MSQTKKKEINEAKNKKPAQDSKTESAVSPSTVASGVELEFWQEEVKNAQSMTFGSKDEAIYYIIDKVVARMDFAGEDNSEAHEDLKKYLYELLSDEAGEEIANLLNVKVKKN